MIAQNTLNGLLTQVQWHEISDLNPEKELLLDVRSPKEVERCAIEGSLHIPLDQLRERLSEVPKGKKLITYCHSGQRSYFASTVLMLVAISPECQGSPD